MKTRSLWTLLLVVGCLCVAAQAFATKIVVEAEHYYTIKSSMASADSQVASGKGYIHIPLQRPHGTEEGAPSDTGHAKFKVKIPASGTYKLWGRAHWYDGCGNSFFFKVDDKPAVVFGNDGTYQRWHWVPGVRLNLSAGVHTFIFQNREDGAKLDQFLLTTSTRYVPVRAEKETSEYVIRPPKENN
ncbi:MAG: hypothetical protein R6V19_14770 [Armatimonadota bacterium]